MYHPIAIGFEFSGVSELPYSATCEPRMHGFNYLSVHPRHKFFQTDALPGGTYICRLLKCDDLIL